MSEREQEYLDLAMALSTSPTLEGVLQESYIEQELLEGANQYRCERCGKLVDAKRVRVAFLNDRLSFTVAITMCPEVSKWWPLSYFA